MRRFNLFAAELQHDADDPEGYRTGYSRLGPGMGASMLAGTLYELPEGQSVCPYHYEHGDEEWLIVLDGRPTVRHVEGEDELSAGDVVCFVAGPEGVPAQIHINTSCGPRAFELGELLLFAWPARPSVAGRPAEPPAMKSSVPPASP